MLPHRSRPAPNRIETDSNLAIRFWMQELGVSRATLFLAIEIVGSDAVAVREFIASSSAGLRRHVPGDSLEVEHPGYWPIAEPVCRVQYVSRAASTLTAGHIDDILSWSREYNPAHAISGVLLFTGRHFSQILEGPVEAVHALLNTIRIDPRHQELRVVSDIANTSRMFREWAMAFVTDFGLRDLIEELWWAGSIDSLRAAELVQHLRHGLGEGGTRPILDSSSLSIDGTIGC